MGFLNKLFGEKEPEIKSYSDFWEWFSKNQATFYEIVRSKDAEAIENKFFSRLGPKLAELKDGFFYLVGMVGESTADLVFTADGNPKNIAFVEELVDAAPNIRGWQFTKLKQPTDVAMFGLSMNGNKFDKDSLSFYPNDYEEMPDWVEITLVHKAFDNLNDDSAKSGAYIFLENYLGELNFLTNIDDLNFCGSSNVEKECIPIEALANYLETRQSLFVEKYDGTRIFTENDAYSVMEADLQSGRKLIATINTDLVKWDKKASHPWMMVVTIGYNGDATNGMPDEETAGILNDIEHSISAELKDVDGYLNIGRQVANNERDIFYAGIDFRKPSQVVYEVQKKYSQHRIDYKIYKDKYWRTVNHFVQ